MKVGIVGCGSIANIHVSILIRIEGVEVIAFADSTIERAIDFKHRYSESANVYSSLEWMLKDIQLDVVHICTPHYMHIPMMKEVLKYKVNVFVEKPTAIHPNEIQEIINIQRENKLYVGISFQNRYNQATQKVDELIRGGTLGKIKGARAFVTWNRQASYYTESSWRGKLMTEGGGALINQGIHTLDLILRWLGRPNSVVANIFNHHLQGIIEVEDTVNAYLDFTSYTAILYITTACTEDLPVLVDLIMENGKIRLEGSKVSVSFNTGAYTRFEFDANPKEGKKYWGNGHTKCILDFYKSMENRVAFQNDIQSTIDTMDVTFAIYESAHKGKLIELKED